MATAIVTDECHVPERIFLFSGKRKSGKDYIADILYKRYFTIRDEKRHGEAFIEASLYEFRIGSDRSVVIKISGPIKCHWAKTFKLDLEELLSDRDYKEKYRHEMVRWSEDVRKLDYGHFCRAAIDMYNGKTIESYTLINLSGICLPGIYDVLCYAAKGKRIWIVSDIRRKTDVRWFRENYGDICRTIRIHSSNKIREKRGWTFTEGIDNTETECDLDEVEGWDLTIINEDGNDIESILGSIMHLV